MKRAIVVVAVAGDALIAAGIVAGATVVWLRHGSAATFEWVFAARFANVGTLLTSAAVMVALWFARRERRR